MASLSSSAAPNSLGFRLDDLADGWNAVPDPPLITGGVRTTPRTGAARQLPSQVRSFLARRWCLPPEADGSVYALMARSGATIPRCPASTCISVTSCIPARRVVSIRSSSRPGPLVRVTPMPSARLRRLGVQGHKWQVDIRGDVETSGSRQLPARDDSLLQSLRMRSPTETVPSCTTRRQTTKA